MSAMRGSSVHLRVLGASRVGLIVREALTREENRPKDNIPSGGRRVLDSHAYAPTTL